MHDSPDDSTDPEVDLMVARAAAAQRAFVELDWPEERVDALLCGIAEAIAERAEDLAQATVDETGLGNVPDKIIKNRLASRQIFQSLVGKIGTGFLNMDESRRVAEIASPMGVIFCLVPRTHPVATFVFKVLIALKSRNAVIMSCHRDAAGVGARTGDLIVDVLARFGAPTGLVQWVRGRTSRRTTLQFMGHPRVAFVLATGGSSMVRAAYSSGTPAIGVGPGNAPVWVCADADLDRVAETVITSKAFDNGVICAAEHNLVVDSAIYVAFSAALVRHGALVTRPEEKYRVLATIFDVTEGHVHRSLHGKSAACLATVAGLQRPGAIRLIVVPARANQAEGPLGREKMAPIVSLFRVRSEDEAIALCTRLLAVDGAGHTAIVHTQDRHRIERFSREIQASRILVNAAGTQGTMGLETGLTPSMTLGSGTAGRTSTTDSVTYTHLQNIRRIAYGTAA